MEQLTEGEVQNLPLEELIKRMDAILESSFHVRTMYSMSKLNVKSLMGTQTVKGFPVEFQRKIAYKTFGFIIQLFNADWARRVRFGEDRGDLEEVRQLHAASQNQWITVSSRIAFEYLMHLIFMLGNGKDFPSKNSAIKPFKKWLKTEGNPYAYFAMSIASAIKFDRQKRTPEVHAASKNPKKILMLAAAEIDNSILELLSIMMNNWQFIIQFADGHSPTGWVCIGDQDENQRWHNIYQSGDQRRIKKEVERIFKDADIST